MTATRSASLSHVWCVHHCHRPIRNEVNAIQFQPEINTHIVCAYSCAGLLCRWQNETFFFFVCFIFRYKYISCPVANNCHAIFYLHRSNCTSNRMLLTAKSYYNLFIGGIVLGARFVADHFLLVGIVAISGAVAQISCNQIYSASYTILSQDK